MTWDEILRSAVGVAALAVSALLGYLLRSKEASIAASREQAAELRKDGVERAAKLLEHLDDVGADLNRQCLTQPPADYEVDLKSADQVAQLARLMPHPELRAILMGGLESLTGAWLVEADDRTPVRQMQMRAYRAMKEALSCYLTYEAIPFKLHEDAQAVTGAWSPASAERVLATWRPKPSSLRVGRLPLLQRRSSRSGGA